MMPLADWQRMFDNPAVIVYIMIIFVVCVPSVASYWYKVKKVQAEADLKHSMIERGMSAEEIERVLKANSEK